MMQLLWVFVVVSGENLRKNYWQNVKKTFRKIWPLNLFAALYFTQPAFIVGAIGIANYLFRKFVIKSPEEERKDLDKTPYLVAASSAAGKGFRNVFYGIPQASYAMVSSLGSKLDDITNHGVKPAPNAAGPNATAAPH